MCGIAGQLRFDDVDVDRRLVEQMTNTLIHRGPDGYGFYYDTRVGLGHRRLAIIDPDGPGQPVSNDDGSLWLIGNHEIYNHIELADELKSRGVRLRTAGDAEVILRLFEEFGVTAFEKIVGMFALAIWDVKQETLYLARDPFGIKPLHYTQGAMGTMLFASEIRALLCDQSVNRQINIEALDGYLRTLSVPEPHSIFTTIHKVPAGHFMRVTRQGTRTCRYLDLKVGSDTNHVDAIKIEHDLRIALENTTALCLRSDVEVGCFLSGGVDSSALLAIATKLKGKPVRSYSIGFDEPAFDERQYSRQVSELFKSHHCEVILSRHQAVDVTQRIVDHLDEPFADSSALPTFVLAKRAGQEVKTVISGEGLDELFAGNQWHFPLEGEKIPSSDMGFMQDSRRAIFSSDALSNLYQRDLLAKFIRDEHDFSQYSKHETTITGLTPADGKLAFDLRSYLPSDMLVKMDRLPMANSLEVRTPYLNLPFARHVAGIDMSLKICGSAQKFLLKKSFRGVLPDAILDRPKKGFAIPIDIWLWQDGKFREMVFDVLIDRHTRERGFFNYSSIEKMIDEHSRLERFHGHRLWTLFMFETWHRKIQRSDRQIDGNVSV